MEVLGTVGCQERELGLLREEKKAMQECFADEQKAYRKELQ